MPIDQEPVVDQWYRHLDDDRRFQVTAIDDEEDIVEIQYFDGGAEELELDSWYELDIEPIGPPENWPEPGRERAGRRRYEGEEPEEDEE